MHSREQGGARGPGGRMRPQLEARARRGFREHGDIIGRLESVGPGGARQRLVGCSPSTPVGVSDQAQCGLVGPDDG